MIWLISHLVGSKIGRGVLIALLVFAIIGVVLFSTFYSGKKSAVLEQKLKDLDALQKKVEVDNELRTLSPADRRERLRKWVRPH